MSTVFNNSSDPRRPNKVHRYKPSPTGTVSDDPTPEYMNLLGMIFSMCGLMLKLKWCAWAAIYCAFISFANSRSSEDTKQMLSSFICLIKTERRARYFVPACVFFVFVWLSISAVVMSYLQNPQPMNMPW